VTEQRLAMLVALRAIAVGADRACVEGICVYEDRPFVAGTIESVGRWSGRWSHHTDPRRVRIRNRAM